jgi:hypothetical protein
MMSLRQRANHPARVAYSSPESIFSFSVFIYLTGLMEEHQRGRQGRAGEPERHKEGRLPLRLDLLPHTQWIGPPPSSVSDYCMIPLAERTASAADSKWR